MLNLDGTNNDWLIFNLNHQNAFVKALSVVTCLFKYFFFNIFVVFNTSIGDSVSLHLKYAVLKE